MDCTHVFVDPPLTQWHATRQAPHDLATFAQLAKPSWPGTACPALAGRIVAATGHQPWLWHPGILAKDIAAARYAATTGAVWVHVVVDHDPLEALSLDVPIVDGPRISATTLRLHACPPQVPPASLPPANPASVLAAIAAARQSLTGRLAVDLNPLQAAWEGLAETHTLAEQITMVLARLRTPILDPPAVVFASQLHRLPAFHAMAARLLEDPIRHAKIYNDAIGQAAGIRLRPLRIEGHRVELPLWALAVQQPRQRVYADTRDKGMVTDSGQRIAANPAELTLAPRALPMTALLRSACCNLFVHGLGGAAYDQITEQWWHAWTGMSLAPRVTVTADLHLPFDVPVADAAELARARWTVHHLPHNLDRQLGLAGPDVERKRHLITSMGADRNRGRRAAAFDEIHRINATWAELHRDHIAAAARDVQRCRDGVANHDVARRRDWCFALYDAPQLQALIRAIAAEPPPS